MKTRLIIWEPIVIDGDEAFYLDKDDLGIHLPCVGEMITVKRAVPESRREPGRPHREKEYPTRVTFIVTSRRHVIYELDTSQYQSMVCELTVERIP